MPIFLFQRRLFATWALVLAFSALGYFSEAVAADATRCRVEIGAIANRPSKEFELVSKKVGALRTKLKSIQSGEYRFGSGTWPSPVVEEIQTLAKQTGNYETLLPLLNDTLKLFDEVAAKLAKEKDFTGGRVATEIFKILNAFCASPSFKKEFPGILEAVSAKGFGLSGASRFMTANFGRSKNPELRAKMAHFFLHDLAEPERSTLINFAKKFPGTEELKQIPIALGVEERLGQLKVRTRSVDYKEWEPLGWMADSTSIGPFKEALLKAADQAPAIHFEIGELLNDRTMKAVFKEIDQKGDQNLLNDLEKLYEKFQNEEAVEATDRPKLGNGKISITSLELYWILRNPAFLKKTTFYQKGKPVPAGEINRFAQSLSSR